MDVVNFVCSVTAAVLYYNTLDAGFVYDDSRAILTNQDILPSTPVSKLLMNDFWGTPLTHGGSHGSYRPLCVLSFRLNYLFGGFQPLGYHLVNVCLHSLATSLVVRMVRVLLPPPTTFPAAATGLLFAAHPVHTEAVAGVVGRADVAACVFYIASFLCYVCHTKHRDQRVSAKNYHQKLQHHHHHHHHHHLWPKTSNERIPATPACKLTYMCEPAMTQHHCGTKSTVETVSVKSSEAWNRHHKYQFHKSNGVVCNGQQIRGTEPRIQEAEKQHQQRNNRNKIKDYLITFLNRFRENGFDSCTSSSSSCNSSDMCLPSSGIRECCDNEWWKQWFAMFGCLCFATCAIFSKETGITVLAVCAVYDVLINYNKIRGRPLTDILTKKKYRRLIGSLLILGGTLLSLLFFRLRQMGSLTPTFATADNPTSRSNSIVTRFLTFCYLPVFNFYLLLWPKWLSYDWSMDAIPRITSVYDARNFLTFIFYYAFYRTVKRCLLLLSCNMTDPFLSENQQTRVPQRSYRHRRHYTKRASGDTYRKTCSEWTQNIEINSKMLATCPVCKHSLSNNNHSVLCRNNNNNNNIPMSDDSGAQCMCIGAPVTDCVSSKRSRNYSHKKVTSRSMNHAELVLLSLAFLSIPFLPATNLFFYVGFVVAERVLYIPSVGYCLLVGVGCHVIYSRTNKKVVLVCLVLLFVVFSARTMLRNRDWKDEESLYRSGIVINPPKSYGNLGSVLNSQGRIDEAEWAYRMALKYRSNMADVHYNLGILLQGREQFEEAIKSYELAIQYRPTLALAHLNLGRLLERLRRCDEAAEVYRRCSRLDGANLKDPRTHEATKISALLHLGRLYTDQGLLDQALQVYQEAMQKMPDYYPPEALYNLLGETFSVLQHHDQAHKWYRVMLKSRPDFIPSHFPYSNTIITNNKSRVNAAQKLFLKSTHRSSTRSAVFQPIDKVIFCYYGSWASYRNGDGAFSVTDIDSSLCSHLVYTFAGVSTDGVIMSLDPYNDLQDNWGRGSYVKFSALAKSNPHVKTLLAVGGWNMGSSIFSKVASSSFSREKFGDSVVKFLKKYGFQGLDLDWEYPTLRNGTPDDKVNFVLLLQLLNKKLHAENLLLTVTVGGDISIIQTAYDIKGVAKSADYISVMTFDYHTATKNRVTGISSPLDYSSSYNGDQKNLNIKASISAWVNGGAPKSKLLVGFPLYGRTFTLGSADEHGVGAAVIGPGRPGLFTQESGYLGYYEICKAMNSHSHLWTEVFDAETASLYAYSGNQWVSFDNEKTFTIKANYVMEEDLGGVMIWPIETDDFQGRCKNGKNPLQTVIKKILGL